MRGATTMRPPRYFIRVTTRVTIRYGFSYGSDGFMVLATDKTCFHFFAFGLLLCSQLPCTDLAKEMASFVTFNRLTTAAMAAQTVQLDKEGLCIPLQIFST
eukprot:1350123-Amorphochlora_amoeboformis.AAC.1